MAGVVNGAAFGSSVVDFTKDTASETNTGQFVMALDVAAFGELDDFTKATSGAFDEMRASHPLPDHDKVRLPGDGKHESVSKRTLEGLVLNTALVKDLINLADEHNVEHPF